MYSLLGVSAVFKVEQYFWVNVTWADTRVERKVDAMAKRHIELVEVNMLMEDRVNDCCRDCFECWRKTTWPWEGVKEVANVGEERRDIQSRYPIHFHHFCSPDGDSLINASSRTRPYPFPFLIRTCRPRKKAQNELMKTDLIESATTELTETNVKGATTTTSRRSRRWWREKDGFLLE